MTKSKSRKELEDYIRWLEEGLRLHAHVLEDTTALLEHLYQMIKQRDDLLDAIQREVRSVIAQARNDAPRTN